MMIGSTGILLCTGLLFSKLSRKVGLPDIIGMLLAGILIGPYVLNWLDPSFLNLSEDLRRIALIIILIRAGFSLDLQVLKKVGRPAFLLSFLPASFEILAYTLIAPMVLPLSWLEAALLGTVMSAVSPAVVVPRMVALNERKTGTDKGIPSMLIAGASCDDVFVLVLFSALLALLEGGSFHAADLMDIPVSILCGCALGIFCGYILGKFLEWQKVHFGKASTAERTILVFGMAFLLNSIEGVLKPWISVSGLLAILTMAATMKNTLSEKELNPIAKMTSNMWSAASIFLFVLVGAAIDISALKDSGIHFAVLIALCLIIRSLGSWLCTAKTGLNIKEQLFVVFAYLPKATIQAAIGSVPLSAGLACGPLILACAVSGIIITAPLGAILIDWSAKRWLNPSGSIQEK